MKPEFLSNLEISSYPDGNRLMAPLRFRSSSGEIVVVPSNVKTRYSMGGKFARAKVLREQTGGYFVQGLRACL